jgi:hypothetical protein
VSSFVLSDALNTYLYAKESGLTSELPARRTSSIRFNTLSARSELSGISDFTMVLIKLLYRTVLGLTKSSSSTFRTTLSARSTASGFPEFAIAFTLLSRRGEYSATGVDAKKNIDRHKNRLQETQNCGLLVCIHLCLVQPAVSFRQLSSQF